REHHGIVAVLDDVDLFSAQFANDRLHAHALHADARAHAIDIAVAAGDGDFRTLAGFARACFDDHRVVVNFGNFLLEQTHHQLRRGARYNHAGVFAGLFHGADHAADAIAHAEAFELRLFLLHQPGFRFAEIENQIRPLDALHHAIDQLAHAA